MGYNGNGGANYDTESLSGTMPDQQGGFGTLGFAMAGMQNGSPDGLALVDDSGTVVEFISYEGSITADGRPGRRHDLGGHRRQRAHHHARSASRCSWPAPARRTRTSPGRPPRPTPRGAVNTGQTFVGAPDQPGALPPRQTAPTPVKSGVAVSFSSAGSVDTDGTITGWAWNFGDGGTSTLANPTHVYAATGTFNVTLTVTDDQGATGGDTATASIVRHHASGGPHRAGAPSPVTAAWIWTGPTTVKRDLGGYTVYRATVSGGPYTALNGACCHQRLHRQRP